MSARRIALRLIYRYRSLEAQGVRRWPRGVGSVDRWEPRKTQIQWGTARKIESFLRDLSAFYQF